MKLLKRALTIIFPARCPFCGAFTGDEARPCKKCLSEVPFVRPPICHRCGAPMSDCSCGQKSGCYSGVCGVTLYKGVGRSGIMRFKRCANIDTAQLFSMYMAAAVQRDFAQIDFDFVTAVPMFNRDRRERGYNQSELLAKGIAEKLALMYYPLLVKNRRTKPQKSLLASERRKNVKGAFSPKCALSGETILLVDDIRTTGATLEACSAALLEAGAGEVYAVCFALTGKNKEKSEKNKNYN